MALAFNSSAIARTPTTSGSLLAQLRSFNLVTSARHLVRLLRRQYNRVSGGGRAARIPALMAYLALSHRRPIDAAVTIVPLSMSPRFWMMCQHLHSPAHTVNVAST
jgi:hypothetical protein